MSNEYRVQKRIGMLIAVFGWFITVYNFFVDVFIRHMNPAEALSVISVWLVFVVSSMVFILSRIDAVVARAFFSLMFFISGLISVFDGPEDYSGLWQMVMGAVCLYKFGFLARYGILKSIVLLVLLSAAITASYILHNLAEFSTRGIANLTFSAVFFGCIYLAFGEELRDLRASNRRVSEELKNNQTLLEINKPFVEFGRNTAGVLNDLRGDLNTIFLSIQSLQYLHSRNKKPEKIDLELIENAVRRLNQRIDLMRYVTSAMPERPEEFVEITWIVESALYPFTISPQWRNRIEFKTSFEGDQTIWAKRIPLLRIAENLISNSCEAFLEERHLARRAPELKEKNLIGRLHVRGQGFVDHVMLEFEDDGPGIPSLKNCDSKRCMECDCFAIGRSGKTTGSGFGLTNVRDLVRSFEGIMSIATSPVNGTSIQIILPRKTPIPRS